MDIPIEVISPVLAVIGSIAGAAFVVGKDREKQEAIKERLTKLEKRDELFPQLQLGLESLRVQFTEYMTRTWPSHERKVENIEKSLAEIIPHLAELTASVKAKD